MSYSVTDKDHVTKVLSTVLESQEGGCEIRLRLRGSARNNYSLTLAILGMVSMYKDVDPAIMAFAGDEHIQEQWDEILQNPGGMR